MKEICRHFCYWDLFYLEVGSFLQFCNRHPLTHTVCIRDFGIQSVTEKHNDIWWFDFRVWLTIEKCQRWSKNLATLPCFDLTPLIHSVSCGYCFGTFLAPNESSQAALIAPFRCYEVMNKDETLSCFKSFAEKMLNFKILLR